MTSLTRIGPLVDRLPANLARAILSLPEVQNVAAISVHDVVGGGDRLNDILLVASVDPQHPFAFGRTFAVTEMQTLTDRLGNKAYHEA